MQKRTGKTYFITGGASGLGEACARRLYAEGANVAIADRDAGRFIFSFFTIFRYVFASFSNFKDFSCYTRIEMYRSGFLLL